MFGVRCIVLVTFFLLGVRSVSYVFVKACRDCHVRQFEIEVVYPDANGSKEEQKLRADKTMFPEWRCF